MTPKPASPCEHDTPRYWVSKNYEEISKERYPVCPFCAPAQKPVSSCCKAEITMFEKEIENIPIVGICTKCGYYCKELEKPAESCEPKKPKEIKAAIKKRLKREQCFGCGNYLDYCVCGKAETQDAESLHIRLPEPQFLITIGSSKKQLVAIKPDGTVVVSELGADKEAARLFYESLEFEGVTLFKKIAALEQKLAQAENEFKRGYKEGYEDARIEYQQEKE